MLGGSVVVIVAPCFLFNVGVNLSSCVDDWDELTTYNKGCFHTIMGYSSSVSFDLFWLDYSPKVTSLCYMHESAAERIFSKALMVFS